MAYIHNHTSLKIYQIHFFGDFCLNSAVGEKFIPLPYLWIFSLNKDYDSDDCDMDSKDVNCYFCHLFIYSSFRVAFLVKMLFELMFA